MTKNILVCYATRYGSTKEAAVAIEDVLSAFGHRVTVADLQEDIDLEGIDAVFIGSPLHLGKWLPEAREFVQYRMNLLNKIPVFAFTTGITLSDPTEHNLLKARFAVDEISLYVRPAESGFFAGRIDSGRLSDPDRQIVKMAGITDGDYMDTEEIRGWATGICMKYINDQA